MFKKILPLVLILCSGSIQAQFNFHWAFPYYSIQNMNIRNGNTDYLVITHTQYFNNFPQVEHKSWGKDNTFSYAHSVAKAKLKNYIFVSIDGTISIKEIVKLHQKLPKTVIFFIHRTNEEWLKELPVLKKIIIERPGWIYAGDPFNPKTPIIRSLKKTFKEQNILLGNQAPGEGLR